jgi:AcrR family transcriptional regulator
VTEAFRRARRPEQKQQRREHLMLTARRLLEDGVPLHELGLNELARSAEVSKANVYRYFESREAVLLALLWDEATRSWLELSPQLHPGREETSTLEGVMVLFARSFAQQPLLCALTAAVPSVLETNLSVEAIATFKRQMLGFLDEAASTFERCCPELSHDNYVALVYDAINLIVGLYPLTHPSPEAVRAMEAPDLAFFRRDFVTEFERYLVALAAQYASRQRHAEAATR